MLYAVSAPSSPGMGTLGKVLVMKGGVLQMQSVKKQQQQKKKFKKTTKPL